MNLSPEQEAVVNSNAQIILAIASPGAGKTFAIIQRIRRLLADGVSPESIVVLTYTNAAANELVTRLGLETQLGFVGTLHSFLFRLLSKHGVLVGLNPPLTIIDEEQTEELFMINLEEIAWKGTVKAVKEEVAKGPVVKRNGTMSKEQIACAAFYHKLKDESVLTFDMVLFYGLHLMERFRMAGEPNFYKHLLVDEVQDASRMDARIYETMPVANRFYTGDGDQAVYSFRGGDVNFIRSLASNGSVTQLLRMEGNYRCGTEICKVAQRLIEHDKARVPKQTISMTGQAGQVVVHREGFATAAREITAVVDDITDRKIPASDCAILLRTNALVAEWTKALQGYGVQVRERKKQEWPDDWTRAKATLALLHNPDNDRLAYAAVRIAAGKEKADELKRESLKQFKTINELALRLPYNLPISEALTQLARMNVSSHSLELMKGFARNLTDGLGIADLILALGREEVREEKGDGVTVCTGHSAKGKEWEAVWLPALEEGYFPCKKEDAAESRRLLYVMITRARNHLWLSWSQRRTLEWEGQVERKASRFLREVTA